MTQVKDLNEARACLLAVIAGADDLDDFIDVDNRNEETLDQVQALTATGESEGAASRSDGDTVVDVNAKEFAEP